MLGERPTTRNRIGCDIADSTRETTPCPRELAPVCWTGFILGGSGFKGLISVLHRGQALDSLLESVVVVPGDVVVDGLVELLDAGEVLAVIHLGF